MAVDPQTIEVGKCYATDAPQARVVTAVSFDLRRVWFIARGGKPADARGWHPGSNIDSGTDLDSFAVEVDELDPCPQDAKEAFANWKDRIKL